MNHTPDEVPCTAHQYLKKEFLFFFVVASTYLVDENIQRGVDGAPLAAGH